MSRTSTSPRHLWIGLLLLVAFSSLQAQTNKSVFTKAYLQLSSGPATHNGAMGQLAIQAVLKNNWTASFSYYNIDMDPKGMPGDYQPGYTILLIFPIPDVLPESNVVAYNLSGGKFFNLGRKTWATTEAGVSVVKGNQFTFRRQAVTSDGWFYTSSNYATTKAAKTTVGGLLKADINWAFASFAGLGVGAFANFNSIQSPVGGELKLMVGWMNRKPKARS